MSTDLRAIMEHDERRRRMLNDPDLVADALLLALALDEVLASRKEAGRRLGNWVDDVAELAWGPGEHRRDLVQRVIGNDVPRFEPIRDTRALACIAPMIRREGLCGKRGTWSTIDRDPETGEARWIGLCGRHRDLQAKFGSRRSAWLANGKPSPPPNVGGVLKRYFAADWDQVYRWAAPWRTPLDGAPEPTPPRPKLRLVRDDKAGAAR